ncbi:Epsin-3, clathrin recruitment and traffic between the Golgi and endosome [Chamberlinius hualienensis]
MDENLSRGYVQLGHRKSRIRITPSSHAGTKPIYNNPPRDPCNCIYLGLLLAGVGFLLPYNSFVSAVDYYQWLYPGSTIVFDMNLIYILVAFFAVILNNIFVESLSLHVRITFGYVISFFTLLFVTLTIVWFDVFDLNSSYRINLLAVAVVAFGCTVQQSSFYGYTSMLPPRYTAAVMTGESAAGLIVSLNRIVTKALLDNVKVNTLIFFSISICIVILCVVIHFVVRKTRFVLYYCNSASKDQDGEEHRKITLEPTEDLGLVDILEAVESRNSYGVLKLQSPTNDVSNDSNNQTTVANHDSNLTTTTTSSDNRKQSITVEIKEPTTANKTYKVEDVVMRMRTTYNNPYKDNVLCWSGIKRGVLARYQVAKIVWPFMLAIGVNYFVTLCLFPGIESEVVSCKWHSWMPVLLIAVFNFSDFIGKVIAAVPKEYTGSQLVFSSMSRVILVPMLVMCAAPRASPLIQSEGWPIAFSLLLGISNGVFGSVPMIMAPTKVPDEHRELTGNIMTMSYSLGLTAGSGMAYLLDLLLGPPLREVISCSQSAYSNSTEQLLYNIYTNITQN